MVQSGFGDWSWGPENRRIPPEPASHTNLDEARHQQLHFRARHGPVQHLPALGALAAL